MGSNVALWLLVTSISSTLLAVCSVVVSWREASRSTQARKWLRGQLLTKTSDARLAKVEAEMTELFSILEKVTTTQRRLSSRAGMQAIRERQANQPPPPGASKAELRKYYGIAGVPGPEVARRQLSESPNGD